jgi:hypothetical protein
MLIYQARLYLFLYLLAFIPDLHLKTLTGEVPFQTVPENSLLVLIGQQHKRLIRPTSEDIANRGLTNDMWELLWKCSDPTPGGRPQFSIVIMTTAGVAKQWRPVQPTEEPSDTFGEFRCQELRNSTHQHQ